MSNDIPAAWHPHLERKGIPVSYRGLASRADVSHEAVRRVVRGWSVKESTIGRVAGALSLDPEVIHELRGDNPDRPVAWEPPAASSLLSHDEREALSRLITLITQGRPKEQTGNDNATPTKTAASAAAGQGKRIIVQGARSARIAPDSESTKQSQAKTPRASQP